MSFCKGAAWVVPQNPQIWRPEGPLYHSPGQRPGNRVCLAKTSPEGAT